MWKYNTSAIVIFVQPLVFFGLCLFSTLFVSPCLGEIGIAAGKLTPPYFPNACGIMKFTDDMIAAIGEGSWDNGTACNRIYKVKCTSVNASGTCKAGQNATVRIFDLASRKGTSMVLSSTARNQIASNVSDAASIHIEFIRQSIILPIACGQTKSSASERD
ncbi:RlpA-like domain superfamily [Sesbania bispinosa]|nr:RlpA-like domain superfamily [Sesbania bispinosa]